jgi:rubredoxin
MTELPPEFQFVAEVAGQSQAATVEDSPEFRRILNLPRRVWDLSIMENDLPVRLSAAFRIPTGTRVLRPIQAAALADGHDLRGLLGPIRVGEGKTDLSFLFPVVVQGIYRPTLLLPAGLIEKTWDEFQQLKSEWICHPAFATRAQFDQAVISYERLGRDSGKDDLFARMPDMIFADEVHKLRNRTAACTKRVERFMRAHPTCIFVGVSGTITKRSIRDYWHLLEWALKQNMPLPRTEKEMEIWAEALDERRVDVLSRRDPGVLMQFCTEQEVAKVSPKREVPLGRTAQMPHFFANLEDKLTAVRQGYQRRLRETPGIVCSPDANLDCSLRIRRVGLTLSADIQEHLEILREDWTTPNGDVLALPTDVWRHARELACGFVYRWEPPPPAYWLTARKRWNWLVRQILTPPETRSKKRLRQEMPGQQFPDGFLYEKYKGLHLDSPFQVANAVVQGRITEELIIFAYQEWHRVKDHYKINVVADWLSPDTLDFCTTWAHHNGNAILWTEHRAFGAALAHRLNTGFCANGGLDANGNSIESYKGKLVVASVAANKEGRNLQAWNKNLVITAPPTGSIWEQMLGRTHRPGQLEDTVYVDWLCACAEQDEGFSQLMADARYIQHTTGQSQKLLYADHVQAPMLRANGGGWKVE